jgi:hypothetical protein
MAPPLLVFPFRNPTADVGLVDQHLQCCHLDVNSLIAHISIVGQQYQQWRLLNSRLYLGDSSKGN